MESPPLGLIVFIVVIFLLSPKIGDFRPPLDDIVQKELRQLETLKNSTYGVPGNLTGLENVGKKVNGSVVLMPPSIVREEVHAMRKQALGTYYTPPKVPEDAVNVTKRDLQVEKLLLNEEHGKDSTETYIPLYRNVTTAGLHGKWSKITLKGITPIKRKEQWDRVAAGDQGTFSLQMEEMGAAHAVQEVKAKLSLSDEHDNSLFHVYMQGLHFVDSGEIVMASTSEHFAGIYGLPHFTLSREQYNVSKPILMETISKAIERQKKTRSAVAEWQPSAEMPEYTPKCDFISYIQLHPLKPEEKGPGWRIPFTQVRLLASSSLAQETTGNPYTKDEIELIEKELRRRTGAPLLPIPPIELSATIYSPTCGYTLSTKDGKGLKVEKYYKLLSSFALTTALLVGFQIWLLIRQMNEASTPSTVSRISLWTIANLSLLDGYLSFAFLLVGIVVETTFLPVVSAGFITLIASAFFGVKFLYTIRQIQTPQRSQATTQNNTPAPATPAPATPAPSTPQPTPASARSRILQSVMGSASALPLPVTAGRAATPSTAVILAPDQDPPANETEEGSDRRDASALLSRFVFFLFCSLFLFMHSLSWRHPYREIFVRSALIAMHSFWVPQIYRNTMRNCRKALTWEFVLGVSAARLYIVLYGFYLTAQAFSSPVDYRMCLVLAGWVWLQIWLLWTQEIFGPRFLVPNHLLPPAYDYHPLLPTEDVEAADSGTKSGMETSNANEARQSGFRTFDCAICMQTVRVPTASKGSGQERGHGEGSSTTGGLLNRRQYMVTPCKHVFHTECLEGWMKYRLQCPIDRNPLPPL